MLTTFHAVRDLPVALLGITRRIAPADLITFCGGNEAGEIEGKPVTTTCDSTEPNIQLAIIIITDQKIGSLNDIVKHLFMKIVIFIRRSTMFHGFAPLRTLRASFPRIAST